MKKSDLLLEIERLEKRLAKLEKPIKKKVPIKKVVKSIETKKPELQIKILPEEAKGYDPYDSNPYIDKYMIFTFFPVE